MIVADATPWVDLGFSQQPGRALKERLVAGTSGDLQRCTEPPTTELVWIRWRLWDPAQAHDRRRGLFQIGGGDTGVPLVSAYVEPGRIFSDAEHQQMVEDIDRAFRQATWESDASLLGVFVDRRIGNDSIPGLIDKVLVELAAAHSILRQPATELSHARPGERGLARGAGLAYTADLPENHLVGWWAAHRARDLRSAIAEVEQQLDHRRNEVGRVDPIVASERAADLAAAVNQAERWHSNLDALRRRIVPLMRLEPPRLHTVGPAVTRDPRRRQLLDAMRGAVDVATLAWSMRLSRFRERRLSELFELWGAVAIAGAIESVGWHLDGAPRVRWLDRWSPERVTWTFSLEQEELMLVYEPHAERVEPLRRNSTGPFANALQRGAALTRRAGDPALFAVVAKASPDYALLLRSGGGTAFTLGDAIATDLEYARNNKSWDRVKEKIRFVSNDYGRGIGWWQPGAITTCSASAGFVLVPGERDRWLRESEVAEELERRDILLLGGSPRDPVHGPSVESESVRGIIETLRAHARDGSQRLPHVPGEPPR